VNRPHRDITFKKQITGLCTFRDEFTGRIWLEVFLIDGLNTDADQIVKIREAIGRIRPDKVQLNTAVRPTAEPDIRKLDPERLQAIAARLGPNCEVVADFALDRRGGLTERTAEEVLSMLKRRPCSLNDICSGLGIHRNEALKYISHFQQRGLIGSEQQDATIYFKALS
jgi:wyosine [tRNA(Phe)-imidazoG37] synthetase (radical SAM superfamily)